MTLDRAHPLSRDELVGTIAPYSGYATSDGAPAGTSIVDANLAGSNDFITGKTILIMSGPCIFETHTAGTFDPITGTIPFAPGFGFSAQITAGTLYRVLTAGSGGGGGFGTVSQDAIYFDQFNGNTLLAGNDGSPTKPLSLAADVATQIAAKKLSKVRVAASEGTGNPNFTLQGPMTGISFWGDDAFYVEVALNNKKANFCDFHHVFLSGQCAAGGFSAAYNCDVDVNDGNGWKFVDCTVSGYRLGASISASFYRCSFNFGSTITFSDGSTVKLAGTGDVFISDTPNVIYVFDGIKVGAITGTVTVNDYTNKPLPEVAVNTTASAGFETNFLNLAVAHYTIDDLVLKSADPGANSVYVRLYKLVNGVLTAVNVDTTHPNGFVITTANFDRYWSLSDMFGKQILAGDQIQITVQASGGGPYAVTGSYASRSA
jgi:hypothetical protein